MSPVPWSLNPLEDGRRFKKAMGWAFAVELVFFLALGAEHLSFFHSPFDNSNLIDAQILKLPANSHLTGAESVKDEDEVYFNPRHKVKVKPKQEVKKTEAQNQVDQGPNLGPTHGPVALYAPSPVIPAYLRDQKLKTSVVIEFLITAQGLVTPRLLESSGTPELDSIALSTVAQWKFKPAAKDNVSIDSKTRLRILFEVH